MVNTNILIFGLITFILLCIVIFQIYICIKISQDDFNRKINNIDNPIISDESIPPPTQPFAPNIPPVDPVQMYDYNKIANPLEEPTTRVDRYLY